MADLGYIVEWQVLNSRYFGVPQNRERVFIIGHIGTEHGREIFPLAADDSKVDKLPGHAIANTITTRAGADTIGSYIGDRQTDRQTADSNQSEWNSQVLIAGLMDYKKPRLSNYTMTLDTKTGSLPGFMTTYVIDDD